ncbi:MAG TPA: (Fe-S)-binding protein [Clostridiaceae bacterium]|nr:(Fe-S)-binding protein [Clostridiaceae bacterium]
MDYKDLVSECINCGKCKEHCEFLNSYNIDLSDTERLEELAYHCFLCGKCTMVCPKNINGQEMVLQMRRNKVADNNGKLAENGYGMLLKEKKNYLFKNYKHAAGKSVLFPGCNFPAFYPETTMLLAEILNENAGMGMIFDCCGKPVSELGLIKEEEAIIARISRELDRAGIEEIVTVCPNCYYYLKPRMKVPVISIYEKLSELGIGQAIEVPEIDVFAPCPDIGSLSLQEQMKPFLPGRVNQIEDVQCCGLGGCAGSKEPGLARKFLEDLKTKSKDDIYMYCASCAGNAARAGCGNVHHILVDIMKTQEKPDTKGSLLNRLKMKFYR